ncbi:MFS transporter [Streptomyces sp. NPDC019531]|uniref:MFS transporter n=1 Tax=Streptomyces sp. NPDC019531 TaxID=3365062 RepID=UPI0038507653
MTESESPPLAGRKEWIALAALSVAPVVVSMDLTVLYFAVPSIAGALHPTGTEQLWMIDIYGFMLAGLLISMGTIGDMIGRRRLLLIGSALFGVASAAAAWADSPAMLITARAAQGVAAATLMPSAIALVRALFPDERQRRSAIAIFSTGMALGTGLGPVISGALLSNFWWGSIFLINLPIIAVLLVAVPLLVPEFKVPADRRTRLDPLSALLSLVAVLSLIWGVKEWAVNGYGVAPVAAIVAGVVAGGLLLVRQRSLATPVIDLGLFRYRGFGPALVLSLTAFFCVIGYGLFSTQYLLDVLDLSPMIAGLWMLVTPVLTGALAPTAAQLVNKVRPAYVIAGALLLAGTGFVLMTLVGTEKQLWLVIPAIALIGAGTSTTLVLVTDVVVTVAPPERTGAVSALQRTFQELGGASGIALFGSIGTALYASRLDTELPSASSLPGDVHDTFGATLAQAATYSGERGRALADAAREAFTTAMNQVALLGVALTVLAALFAVLKLRHLSYAQPQEAPADTEDGRPESVARLG